MNIVFTDVLNISKDFYPTPASENIPEWYKKIESYLNDGKVPPNNGMDVTNGTIKRCMPVFDVLTAGYIIYTYCDLFVTRKDGAPYYQWSSHDAIGFHDKRQITNHPKANGFNAPKWINAFGIETPPGYSCLFIPPAHRPTDVTIFEAVVDTDQYTANVNLPFYLNDPTFTGLIPAGTPLAQVIPFKREQWTMSLGDSKNREKVLYDYNRMRSKFYDGYKLFVRQKKEYK